MVSTLLLMDECCYQSLWKLRTAGAKSRGKEKTFPVNISVGRTHKSMYVH